MNLLLNPMLLPNIVCNIFQHIADKVTLKKFRLVCRCWNLEACIALRHLETIQFTSIKSLQTYTTIFQSNCEMFEVFPHSNYKFEFRIDQTRSKPYLSSDNEDQPLLLLHKLIHYFLDYFGNYITCCHIPVRSNYFEGNFLEEVLSKLPNISALGLHIQYFHQQTLPLQFSQKSINHLQGVRSLIIQIEGLEMSEDKTTEMLSMLFLHLPNLQQISCPGDIRRISQAGLLLRDIILESETSTNLINLGDWNFKTRLLEEQCLQLLCKEFPMRTLYIDLYNPDDDQNCVGSDIMAGLFRKWNKTLYHLEIEFPYRKEVSFHFHFPLVMENLKSLYLGGFEGCLIDLLRKLPRLSNLELSQLELMSILPKAGEDDVYLNVNKLRIDFCTGQTAGILSRFSRIFPRLQNLNINHATNEVIRVIFKKMTCLSTLTIQGDELTDAGMCGFSEYATKEEDFLCISTTNGNKYRKYPCIADLKELNYLNLDAFALTEVTVRHGLVHCHSLRLVKMDCTAGGDDSSSTVSRKFRLSEYENHLVEEGQRREAMIEMKEEPPLEGEALAFFQSHDKYSDDVLG